MRGVSGRYSAPYSSRTWLRAAPTAAPESVVESVRM